MNNLKFISFDYLTVKESGISDWRRDFYDRSISSHSIRKVMPSRHLTEYSTLRDNARHKHTQHWSIDWNRSAAACLERYERSTYVIPVVCDAIIVSTISRMSHAIAAVVIVILNAGWWSWARLCCVWKLPNLSWRQKSGLQYVKRADFIRYWWRSGLKYPDKPNNFIKKNVRNHSYHQLYPVLTKIRINRGLL